MAADERKVCPIDGKEEVGQKPGDEYCIKHGVKLVSPSEAKSSSVRLMAYAKIIFDFVDPAVPPLVLILFAWSFLAAQDILIYAGIIFVLGYIAMFFTLRKHGYIVGSLITVGFVIVYTVVIAIITIIVTGDSTQVIAFANLLTPASYRDSMDAIIQTNFQSLQTGFQTSKCAIFNSLNYQTCITSSSNGGNGNVPKICKPIDQYKFLNIQFGEAPDYTLTDVVRVDNIYPAKITVTANGDRTISGITLSPNSELKDSNGNTIKMQADRCITPEENCQVGPNLPPLVVTLRTVDKVNFQVNDLAFLYVYVSYPFEQSGSNTFYIGNSRVDVQSEIAKSQGPSLGIGPLDSHVTFSTNYYITGSSINNPNAAKIEVDANVVNGKENCYGEEGYGRVSQIKISHTSDIQGIAASCKTPEQIPFSEDQTQTVAGTQVKNIQTYPCTFTAPDNIGDIGSTSIVFTSTISYTYTEVKLTQNGMTVCPSDTSISCQ